MTTVQSAGTLLQVRTAVSRLIERRDFLTGTAIGGSVNSIIDPSQVYETGHYTGREIYFTSGANAGSTAFCTGSDVGVLMFNELPFAVANGDKYEVRAYHNKADVDAAVQRAIQDTWNVVWVPAQYAISITNPYPGGISLMNTPPTTSPDMLPPAYQELYTMRVEDPRAYSLPSGLVLLTSVQFLDDSNPPVMHTMRHNHWFSRFDGNVYIDAGAWPTMKQTTIPTTLNGYRLPITPALDTDVIEVPTDYVMWKAAAMLTAQGFASQAIDIQDQAHAFSTWEQLANARLMQARTYIAPNSRRMVA